MIPPEALCWLCKKPGCDAESEVVTVKDPPDSESGFVRVRTEYYHRACLKEWHKRFIPLLDDRPGVSESREGFESYLKRTKQALEEFRKNRGKE